MNNIVDLNGEKDNIRLSADIIGPCSDGLSPCSDEIVWLKATRERRTANIHAVTYGVECSRCRCFQDYETRFCKDCGGRYTGPLPVFNKYAERKMGFKVGGGKYAH